MEIGSEFWLEDKNKIEYESEFIKSENLFLSGRTAIDYALQIIENIKKIEKVYFPSYYHTVVNQCYYLFKKEILK